MGILVARHSEAGQPVYQQLAAHFRAEIDDASVRATVCRRSGSSRAAPA